jgi:hypothetical protein
MSTFRWHVEGRQDSEGTMARSHEERGEVEAECAGEAFAKLAHSGLEWGMLDDDYPITLTIGPEEPTT